MSWVLNWKMTCAVSSDLKIDINDILSEISAIKYIQQECEQKVTEKFDKKLKGVTSVVEQQTRSLPREHRSYSTWYESHTTRLRGAIGGGRSPKAVRGLWQCWGQRRQGETVDDLWFPWAVFHPQFEVAVLHNDWTPREEAASECPARPSCWHSAQCPSRSVTWLGHCKTDRETTN
jgi:hypothetical protein